MTKYCATYLSPNFPGILPIIKSVKIAWKQFMLSVALADPGFGQGGTPEIFSEILPM